MDAFPYNTGADADKSRLKIIRTVTADGPFGEPWPPADGGYPPQPWVHRVAKNPNYEARSAARAQVLMIERAMTADLPAGRQMPPLGDGWHAVGRITGTRWRRIALPNNPHE